MKQCRCVQTKKRVWQYGKRDNFSFLCCLRCGEWWEESLDIRAKIYRVSLEYVMRHLLRWKDSDLW